MVTISLVGKRAVSLMKDFDKAGIYYEKRRPGRPGEVMPAPQWVLDLRKFMEAHPAWDVLIVPVLMAWKKASSKRKINVAADNGTIISTEGLSANQFEKVVKVANSILAIEVGDPPKRALSKRNAANKKAK